MTTTFTGPVVSLNGFVGDVDFPDALEVTSLVVDTTATVTGILTATGGVVGAVTGALNGILGGVTPAAATVTTLAASGLITATGGVSGVLGATGPAAATVTTLTTSGAVVGGTQNLSGAGVVNVTSLTTKVTSTGSDALTLANGTDGQLKAVVMVVDGGDATLTPTTKTGFTTIVFSAVGQSVLLQYFTTLGWMIISNNGAAAS